MDLRGYDILIEKFVKKELTAEEFELAYLDKYLNDKGPLPEDLYQSLEWLFAEVDYFSNDPEYLPDAYRTADQLRESAAETLAEIRALK